MKILLINANALRYQGRPWHDTGRKHAYAPTTLTTLAALVPPELEAEIFLIDEAIDTVPDDFKNADLVGISAMTCDVVRAYELADMARKQGIATVLGGYHVTFMPDEAQKYADALVIGFAEEAWPRLLRDFAKHHLEKRYEGAWEHQFSMNMPPPRRELLNRPRYLIPATLESTRGCPNNCRFCVIPSMHKRVYIARSIESISMDLEATGSRRVAFLDSNPFEDSAQNSVIFPLLTDLRISWYAASSMRCAMNKQWVKTAAQSGCKGLLIGFESLNGASLAGAGKGFNHVDEYQKTITMLHDHGIAVLGCFVFGFDQDDTSVFSRTVEFVDRSGIDLVLYSIFTPLPGSPVHARLAAEKRITIDDWRRYDGRHATFTPARMNIEQLEQGLYDAWSKTYGIASIIKRAVLASPSPFFSLVGNIAFRYYRRTFVPEAQTMTIMQGAV